MNATTDPDKFKPTTRFRNPSTPTMDSYDMFKIMGIILGAVFLLIVIIIVVFCVKSCRRRRENIKIYRSNQRNQQEVSLHIEHNTFDDDFRTLSTHQPTYGQNMSRDPEDDNTINIDSSSRQNGTCINNSVQVNSDSMYDLPKALGGEAIPIIVNIECQNEESPRMMSTFEPRKLREKPLCRYDDGTKRAVRNLRPDNHDNLGYPDYENSPNTRRKNSKQLTSNPRPYNNKVVRIHDNSKQKSQDKRNLVKQDSDYEDPDKVVALRKNGMGYGSYTSSLRNVNKDNATNSEIPEYSNLQFEGLVVKSERIPSAPIRDYVNEEVIEDLKNKGPPVPKKRAHTTATYDRPHRPVVIKRGRTFSNSNQLTSHQDDMYVAMDGTHAAADDNDDMYIPMDSNDIVENVCKQQLNSTLRRNEITPPARCPNPTNNMVPKRSFDKSYTLNVKPPPCGVGKNTYTSYVNYDENPKYVNLFKSKSTDDIYVYADANDDAR